MAWFVLVTTKVVFVFVSFFTFLLSCFSITTHRTSNTRTLDNVPLLGHQVLIRQGKEPCRRVASSGSSSIDANRNTVNTGVNFVIIRCISICTHLQPASKPSIAEREAQINSIGSYCLSIASVCPAETSQAVSAASKDSLRRCAHIFSGR
jgi:hypothetical protein